MSTKDLNVGDQFEIVQEDGTSKKYVVVEKGTTAEGIQFVRSSEVTA